MAAGLHRGGRDRACARPPRAYGRRRLLPAPRRGRAGAGAQPRARAIPARPRAAARERAAPVPPDRRRRLGGARRGDRCSPPRSRPGGAGPALARRGATSWPRELAGQGLRWEAALGAARRGAGADPARRARRGAGATLRAVGPVRRAPDRRPPARPRRPRRARRRRGPSRRRAQAPARRAVRPARLAELVRLPRPADRRGRPRHPARRPRPRAGGRVAASPTVLFEWSERARMLASRVQPVRAPEDEQLVADLTELREMARPTSGRRDSPSARPSCGSGSASGPGSTGAPARSPTR